MGGKKKHNQKSNKPPGGRSGSSESGGSRASSVTPSASKCVCPHLNKAVDQASVRKNFKLSGQQAEFICNDCKKDVGAGTLNCEDPWVCLRCGSCSCGPKEKDHITSHHKTPRSDLHVLALSLQEWTLLCFHCKIDIPIDCNKKIGALVKMLKQQYSKHLRTIPDGVSEISTTAKNAESPESKFQTTYASDVCKKTLVNASSNVPRVRGLSNLGNTCFFNSVLQCLAQTNGLVELLRAMEIPGEKFIMKITEEELINTELDKGFGIISEALASTLTQVAGLNGSGSGDKNNSNFVVNPRQLLTALRKKCPQFEGCDQHDAHELLRHLLDSVRIEDLRRYHRTILSHVGLSSKEKPQEMDENKKKKAKILDQLVCENVLIRPDHIFKGMLISRLECQTCHHTSERMDSFLDLSLPVTLEKPQPPSVIRRRNHSHSGTDEDMDTYFKSKQEVSRGKFGQRKRVRMKPQLNHTNNDHESEATIAEEDKKVKDSESCPNTTQDCLTMESSKMTIQKKSRRRKCHPTVLNDTQLETCDKEDNKGLVSIVEPSDADADVEDNEDGGCDEHRLEVLESGYSSEKQASPRTSPLTHSPGEELEDTFIARSQTQKRSESGLGSSTLSIQELTVAIPDSQPHHLSIDLVSPNSTHANASPGSQEVSSDGLQNDHRNNRSDDILIRRYDSCNNFFPSDDNCTSNSAVYEWQCDPFSDPKKSDSDPENIKCLSNNSNDSSSISIPNTPPGRDSSISQSSQDLNANCSSKDNSETVIENTPHDDLEIVNGESSQQGERPISRLEFHEAVARSSPVDLVKSSAIDTDFLNLQLENYKAEKSEEKSSDEIPPMHSLFEQSEDDLPKLNETSSVIMNDQEMGFVLVNGIVEVKSELPNPKFRSKETKPPPEDVVVSNGSLTLAPRYTFEEGECSLQSCLNQFTAIEIMTGNNKVGCESCTARQAKVSGNKENKTVYTPCTKQLLISSIPPIMIFHFKRFEVQMYSIRKISKHVKFPLVLDIAPFCSVKCKAVEPGQTQILYSLYAVVEHSGTLRGGHYVAYVKVRSKQTAPTESNSSKWYYISDSRVSEVSENRVLNSEAYLLFYERLV